MDIPVALRWQSESDRVKPNQQLLDILKCEVLKMKRNKPLRQSNHDNALHAPLRPNRQNREKYSTMSGDIQVTTPHTTHELSL